MITTTNSNQQQLVLRTNTKKKSFKYKLKFFCFPFFPIKLKNTIHLITLLACLIAIRFITQLFSIPVGPSLRISFNWIPMVLIGWLFGPIFGIFIGFITDSITFFISGSIWFWMYAIQEPLIMMFSGIIGSIYRFKKETKNWKWDYSFFQIILLLFLFIAIFVLVRFASNEFTNSNINPLGMSKKSTVILTSSCLIIFFVIVQTIVILFLFLNKLYRKEFVLFIYVTLLSILLSMFFSFILGTISAIYYFSYISNNNPPSNIIKYGAYYFLIPRVVKESFKVPLNIIILFSVLKIAEPNILLIKQMSYQKW